MTQEEGRTPSLHAAAFAARPSRRAGRRPRRSRAAGSRAAAPRAWPRRARACRGARPAAAVVPTGCPRPAASTSGRARRAPSSGCAAVRPRPPAAPRRARVAATAAAASIARWLLHGHAAGSAQSPALTGLSATYRSSCASWTSLFDDDRAVPLLEEVTVRAVALVEGLRVASCELRMPSPRSALASRSPGGHGWS